MYIFCIYVFLVSHIFAKNFIVSTAEDQSLLRTKKHSTLLVQLLVMKAVNIDSQRSVCIENGDERTQDLLFLYKVENILLNTCYP